MLTKKQLEDAQKCVKECESCSMSGVGIWGIVDCITEVAKTALAYREMLEQLTEELRDTFDSGVFGTRWVNSLKDKLEEAEKMLQKSYEGR